MSRHEMDEVEPKKCKCGGRMGAGLAMENTVVGRGDFRDSDHVVSMSLGGSGKLIKCWKCQSCGYSEH